MTSPIAIPATGALIGTPASIKAKVEPQIDACEDEPLDSNTSLTIRTVYGNSVVSGIMYFSALSPNAPCPISRRPGALTGPVSPTEKLGSCNDA